MSLEPRIEMNLAQKLGMKLKQSLELKMQMAKSISSFRSEVGGDPNEGLKTVIEEIVNKIEEPELKEAIQVLFADEGIRQNIISNSHHLIAPVPNYERVAAGIVYDSNAGTDKKMTLVDEEGQHERVGVIRARFMDALFSPGKVQKELDGLTDLLKGGQDSEGIMMARRELQNALQVAGATETTVAQLGQLVGILAMQEEDGNPILKSFLQDMVLLKKLDFVITDRLANRFAASFVGVNQNRNQPERFHNAMLNSVAEYTLIAMGIIDPNIFQLKRAEVNYTKEVREELASEGIDLDQLLARYNLQGEGTLFWNRYFVKGMKPNAITDELIRDFITRTVRKSKGEILDAIDFEERFEEIKETLEDAKKKRLKKDAKKELMKGECVKIFMDEGFSRFLADKIKSEWRGELDIFYPNKKDKEKAA